MATDQPEKTRPSAVQSGLRKRFFRAIRGDSRLYEEVEHDPKANQQVLLVIGIVATAQAAGIALENLISAQPLSGTLLESIVGFGLTLAGIGLWSLLLYFIGTRLFQGKATPGEVWRASGFARSPGIFYIIPVVGMLANPWMIYTNIKAARQALDVSTGRALAASILSFLPYLFLIGVLQTVTFQQLEIALLATILGTLFVAVYYTSVQGPQPAEGNPSTT